MRKIPTMTRNALVLPLALAVLLPVPAAAQWSRVHEQFYFPAGHNWEFRDRYRIADRLFNAFDYGHAILYEVLYTQPDAPASKLEVEEYEFITRKLLPKPPRLPLEEGAIEVAYAKLVPEAKAMFEWAHVLHRQIYDVLAAERLSQEEKDAEISALLRYYRSRGAYAFSSQPKTMELMEGHFYSTAFREGWPKFNGLIWAYHWLQVGLYEPLMVGRNYDERQTGVSATVSRFFQMIENAPANMPRVMPMTALIAPTFAARYPEAAIIFDNLHSMHDVISDILASPEVPRNRKRAEILLAAQRFRDDTSFVTTVEGWRTMAAHMGIENMGGPAVGFLPAFPTPTVARGAVMADMQHDTPAAAHAGHEPAAPDTAAHAGHAAAASGTEPSLEQLRTVHERMMADPVIRERVESDPVLRKLLDGMHGATDSAAHAEQAPAAADPRERATMEFITRLLAEPAIEQRIHADPELHRIWSDPAVQQCLAELRRLKQAGRPLPAACPRTAPVAPAHRH